MKRIFINNRIRFLFLSVMFSISIAIVGTGEVYAYYLNESSHQVVCTKTSNLPESNCLKEEGQIILLNDWELSETDKTQVELKITLFSEKQDIEGFITCESAQEYLLPSLWLEDGTAVSSLIPMVLKAGEPTTVRLVLKKNPEVLANIDSVLEESIQVVWTNYTEEEQPEVIEMISATVLVDIIPKEVIQPELEEDTADMSGAEDSIPESSDNTSEEAEGLLTETDESVSEETTEDMDAVDSSYLVESSDWQVDTDILSICNTVCSSSDPLIANITYPAEAEYVLITTNSFSGISGFPAYTRYSLDGGVTYIILGDGGNIKLPASQSGTDVLQIDVSMTTVSWGGETCVIESVGVKGDTKTTVQSDSVGVKLDITTSLEVTTESNPPVVTKDRKLSWNVVSSVPTVDYKIEVLTKDGYREVVLEDMLLCEVAITEGNGIIRISSQDGLAKAGTYKLTVSQMYDSIEVQNKEVTFFVNYR